MTKNSMFLYGAIFAFSSLLFGDLYELEITNGHVLYDSDSDVITVLFKGFQEEYLKYSFDSAVNCDASISWSAQPTNISFNGGSGGWKSRLANKEIIVDGQKITRQMMLGATKK